MDKDAKLACLLNLLVPGVGHVYIDQTLKGILILLVWFVLWRLFPIGAIALAIWAMFDAYKAAKRTHAQKEKTSAETVK